jgi:hypothetical protein
MHRDEINLARVLGPMITGFAFDENECAIGLLRIYGLFEIRPSSIPEHRPMKVSFLEMENVPISFPGG